ncbi:MAG TPA: carboxymuconolactone decarboxylase family protein [Longimicrobiales bacterium]|nr:carboxymuconolactone decarboxylase family protein [Longimicrobiales bacterium]
MDEATRALVTLSAALAAGDPAVLGPAMDAAARAAPAEAVEEALLQSHLFLGYPTALRALGLWRERSGRPASAASTDGPADWRARGEAVCAQVYGGAYERLRENVARLHPDVERWMVEDGYGRVLGRPGLDLRRRELCIVAMLAGLAAPQQLHSHLRGALNVGASPEDVAETLELAGEMAPPARRAQAWRVWDEVRERWVERRAGGQGSR